MQKKWVCKSVNRNIDAALSKIENFMEQKKIEKERAKFSSATVNWFSTPNMCDTFYLVSLVSILCIYFLYAEAKLKNWKIYCNFIRWACKFFIFFQLVVEQGGNRSYWKSCNGINWKLIINTCQWSFWMFYFKLMMLLIEKIRCNFLIFNSNILIF